MRDADSTQQIIIIGSILLAVSVLSSLHHYTLTLILTQGFRLYLFFVMYALVDVICPARSGLIKTLGSLTSMLVYFY